MPAIVTALLLAAAASPAAVEPPPPLPPLPADVHADSRSRMPLLPRSQLDPEGQRIWDSLTRQGTVPLTGPARLGMYSPKAAESNYALNQAMRATVNGTRYFELAALIAAREFDQQYVWTQHEPAALQAGLEPRVIDVVKHDHDPAGLPERDRAAIRLGRALFREHQVSPALWAETVELFGSRGAAELVITLGEYAMSAVIVTAVDQQLPAGKVSLLPAR